MTLKSRFKEKRINIAKVVGRGYKKFWNFKGRYNVIKGSRASKKSKTTALRWIYLMMKYDKSNLLVIRKTYRTLKDSCWTDLKWATRRLEVENLWSFKESPLEATYLPTGQKILFRGLDDPLKVTSITVDYGYLCWAWLEEAFEVNSEADFDTLDESIRGELPSNLWKQWVISFNPWNERHWLKKKFFDVSNPDILAQTTNYTCNEWLDEADKRLFENMKINNPRRYNVAGLGNWGITEGLVYDNVHIDYRFELTDMVNYKTVCGMDFGYTNDPTAFFIGFLDEKNKALYIWDELYEKGLTNRMIYDRLVSMGYGKESIVCDSAEPKSIAELRGYGLRAKAAVKGKDSISHGIQYIQGLTIYIHPRCVNFTTEIQNYTFDKDKFGNAINQPIDDFNHLMDAMRYALEKYAMGKVTIKTFK
jgi:phage terminase large subunit